MGRRHATERLVKRPSYFVFGCCLQSGYFAVEVKKRGLAVEAGSPSEFSTVTEFLFWGFWSWMNIKIPKMWSDGPPFACNNWMNRPKKEWPRQDCSSASRNLYKLWHSCYAFTRHRQGWPLADTLAVATARWTEGFSRVWRALLVTFVSLRICLVFLGPVFSFSPSHW